MTKQRLTSLDVFRGFTIILMTIVNNPGSWSFIYPPLEHAEWNGCTPTDLVFPFFIFIMGTAIPFAMPNKVLDGAVFNKIFVRSLRIFSLGLFLNFFSQINLFGLEGIALLLVRLALTLAVAYALLGDFSMRNKTILVVAIASILFFLAYSGIEEYKEVRIPGVLQRIGIVYFFASLLYLKSNYRVQILTTLGILILYWGLMSLIPVPGIGVANFEKGTSLAAYIDSLFLQNHMWSVTKTWDPEGILSTIPAIATGIIGMLIGQLLNRNEQKIEIFKKMIIAGAVMTALGAIWDIFFPINKALWTSSYVLYTSGLATLCLATLYYLIDIANYKNWIKLFLIWGVNPMIVFFFSGIIPRVFSMIQIQNPELNSEKTGLKEYIYNAFLVPLFTNPLNASLSYALWYAVFWSLVLAVFYKYKLMFKV